MRPLTPLEAGEASIVFGDAIEFGAVRMQEDTRWPDLLAQATARLRGDPPPPHNAVTLGNRIHFPIPLRTADAGAPGFLDDMGWLIHELTHVWQYQHQGPIYLWRAVWAQITLGSGAYGYGWEAGLQAAAADGKTLTDFNPEQQGEIARHYYYRKRQGLDTTAWQLFVAGFQMARMGAIEQEMKPAGG